MPLALLESVLVGIAPLKWTFAINSAAEILRFHIVVRVRRCCHMAAIIIYIFFPTSMRTPANLILVSAVAQTSLLIYDAIPTVVDTLRASALFSREDHLVADVRGLHGVLNAVPGRCDISPTGAPICNLPVSERHVRTRPPRWCCLLTDTKARVDLESNAFAIVLCALLAFAHDHLHIPRYLVHSAETISQAKRIEIVDAFHAKFQTMLLAI